MVGKNICRPPAMIVLTDMEPICTAISACSSETVSGTWMVTLRKVGAAGSPPHLHSPLQLPVQSLVTATGVSGVRAGAGAAGVVVVTDSVMIPSKGKLVVRVPDRSGTLHGLRCCGV